MNEPMANARIRRRAGGPTVAFVDLVSQAQRAQLAHPRRRDHHRDRRGHRVRGADGGAVGDLPRPVNDADVLDGDAPSSTEGVSRPGPSCRRAASGRSPVGSWSCGSSLRRPCWCSCTAYARVAACAGRAGSCSSVAGRHPTVALGPGRGAGCCTAAGLDPAIPPVSYGLLVLLCVLWALVTPAWAGRFARVTLVGRGLCLPALLATAASLLLGTGVRIPLALALAAAALMGVGCLLPARFGAVADAIECTGARMGRLGHRNLAFVERVGRPIGAVLGAIAMIPVVVLLVLSWGIHRLVRYDGAGSAGGPFHPLGRADRCGPGSGPRLSAAPGVGPARRPADRERQFSALVTVLAVVLGAVVLVANAVGVAWPWYDEPSGPQRVSGPVTASSSCLTEEAEPNPVLDGQPQSRRLICELRAFVHRPLFDATTAYRLPRLRREARQHPQRPAGRAAPPAVRVPSGPRLVVRWIGRLRVGPAGPARPAVGDRQGGWKRGIALDIDNYAMPAWVLGQEARRFEQMLMAQPKPDLVMFYDGVGNVGQLAEGAQRGRGRGADESETSSGGGDRRLLVERSACSADVEISSRPTAYNPKPPDLPRGGGRPRGEPLRPQPQAGPAHRRCRPTRADLLLAAAHALGAQAARRVEGIPPEDDPIWARMVPAARRRLPKGVIDLSDSLDGVRRPVFDDFYHHNEYAAGGSWPPNSSTRCGPAWRPLRRSAD